MNNKNKICVICHDAYAVFKPKLKAPFGGGQTMAYMIAKSLAKLGNEVVVLSYDYGQKKKERCEGVILYRDDSRRLTKYHSKCTTILRRINDWIKIKLSFESPSEYYNCLRKNQLEKINADQYFLFGVSPSMAEAAHEIKSLKKEIVTFLIHDEDVSDEYYEDSKFVNRHGQLGSKCFPQLLLCDAFVAQNQFQLNAIKTNFNRDCAILINSPIELYEKKINFSREYFLWVGRATAVKRPELVIELALKLTEHKFMLISSAEIFNYLNELNVNVPKNVEIKTEIPFNEIDTYFSKCKAFINTSISEGMPITFLHAGKNHSPVFTLGINPNEYITKYNAGMVCSSTTDLAERLNINDEELSKYGENSLEYVRQEHDIILIADKIQDYLSSNEIIDPSFKFISSEK